LLLLTLLLPLLLPQPFAAFRRPFLVVVFAARLSRTGIRSPAETSSQRNAGTLKLQR